MNHPLTDQMIEKMMEEKFSENYDEGYVAWIMGGMRAAADWQLEQVIEWLEETESDQFWDKKVIYAEDLKEAMRPQENN